jgi:hypothetical protein
MTERDAIDPMGPAEFRDHLLTIGWRTGDVAAILRIEQRVAARWASGVREVPRYVGHWVRTLAACHAEHPYPEGWRLAESEAEVIDEGTG